MTPYVGYPDLAPPSSRSNGCIGGGGGGLSTDPYKLLHMHAR